MATIFHSTLKTKTMMIYHFTFCVLVGSHVCGFRHRVRHYKIWHAFSVSSYTVISPPCVELKKIPYLLWVPLVTIYNRYCRQLNSYTTTTVYYTATTNSTFYSESRIIFNISFIILFCFKGAADNISTQASEHIPILIYSFQTIPK